MNHSTFDAFLSGFDSAKRLVLITSINYEIRSLSTIKSYVSWAISRKFTPFIELIELQAKTRRIEPLEHIKDANIQTGEGLVRYCKTEPSKTEFSYPDFSASSLLFKMQYRATVWPPGTTLVIDISALPTRVILAMMDFAKLIEKTRKDLTILYCYTWPESYPKATTVTQVGAIKLLRHDMALQDLQQKRIKCIVALGSQGFDAGELLEVLPSSTSTELLLFMHRDDLSHSIEVLTANASALSGVDARIHYFSTMERGIELMKEMADGARAGGFDTLLIANFSVKPLTLAAYIAIDRFSPPDSHFGRVGDIVSLSMHHYGSVYSIGAGITSIYSHTEISK